MRICDFSVWQWFFLTKSFFFLTKFFWEKTLKLLLRKNPLQRGPLEVTKGKKLFFASGFFSFVLTIYTVINLCIHFCQSVSILYKLWDNLFFCLFLRGQYRTSRGRSLWTLLLICIKPVPGHSGHFSWTIRATFECKISHFFFFLSSFFPSFLERNGRASSLTKQFAVSLNRSLSRPVLLGAAPIFRLHFFLKKNEKLQILLSKSVLNVQNKI